MSKALSLLVWRLRALLGDSAGRTRTYNPSVTHVPVFSHRGGLSHQLWKELPGARGGLIGRLPQPLVSARSCLLLRRGACLSTGFAQDCRAGSVAGVGFPEFTRFFNHSHLWKLQLSCVKFTMTVGAQQDAFVDLFFHLLPTPRISLVRYSEVFLCWVEVVKFQSLDAPLVTADLTERPPLYSTAINRTFSLLRWTALRRYSLRS